MVAGVVVVVVVVGVVVPVDVVVVVVVVVVEYTASLGSMATRRTSPPAMKFLSISWHKVLVHYEEQWQDSLDIVSKDTHTDTRRSWTRQWQLGIHSNYNLRVSADPRTQDDRGCHEHRNESHR